MRRVSHRQRLALLVLVLVSISFIAADVHADSASPLSSLRSGVGSVLGPVQRVAGSIFAPVVGGVRSLGSLSSDHRRAKQLAADNARLRGQLRAAELDRDRSRQLAGLDLLAGRGGYTVVPAHVIALGPRPGFDWTATIDAGSRDGVRVDQTVVTGAGLVGRIKLVSPYTATVLLAIDTSSAVGSRLESSGQLGITTGNGQRPMRLRLLDPQANVRIGDRLVTGPYGVSSYAAGVPIGQVSAVSGDSSGSFRTAEVRPYVDFTALDVVGVVVVKPRIDPRDSVLPPKPSASASPSASSSASASASPGASVSASNGGR